jgi:hypothetical protein
MQIYLDCSMAWFITRSRYITKMQSFINLILDLKGVEN